MIKGRCYRHQDVPYQHLKLTSDLITCDDYGTPVSYYTAVTVSEISIGVTVDTTEFYTPVELQSSCEEIHEEELNEALQKAIEEINNV